MRTGTLTIAAIAVAQLILSPGAALAQQSAPPRENPAEANVQEASPVEEDVVRPQKRRPRLPPEQILRDVIDVLSTPALQRPPPSNPGMAEPFPPQGPPPEYLEPAETFVPPPAEPVAQPVQIPPSRPDPIAVPLPRPAPPIAPPRVAAPPVTPAPKREAPRPTTQPSSPPPPAQSAPPASAASPPTPETEPAPTLPLPYSEVPAKVAAAPDAVPAGPDSGGWNNWYWAAIIAAVAAAVSALNHWRNRRMLDRTRSALALHPSLDPAEGNCVTDGLALAGPAMSIRSRLEMGSSAWQTR